MTESLSHQPNKRESQVTQWLRVTVKLPRYISIFKENGFETLDVMEQMKMNDLSANHYQQ